MSNYYAVTYQLEVHKVVKAQSAEAARKKVKRQTVGVLRLIRGVTVDVIGCKNVWDK